MDEIKRFFENSEDDQYCMNIAEQLEPVNTNSRERFFLNLEWSTGLSTAVRKQLEKVCIYRSSNILIEWLNSN